MLRNAHGQLLAGQGGGALPDCAPVFSAPPYYFLARFVAKSL